MTLTEMFSDHMARWADVFSAEPNQIIYIDLAILGIFVALLVGTGYAIGRWQNKSAAKMLPTPTATPKSDEITTVPEVEPVGPDSKPDKKPAQAIEPDLESKTAEVPWSAALKRSREPLLTRLQDAWSSLTGDEVWDENHPLWESLEEALIVSDIGPKMTESLLQSLRSDFREKPTVENLKSKLRSRMMSVFEGHPAKEISPTGPRVTVLIGVNGSGKTTTAGKLAHIAKSQGKKVVLGAGDTFRAAAVEQLQAWADRLDVECVVPAKGANPAAVAFDAVAAGLARSVDEIIIDTAGRLHTNESLMDELAKVGRVIGKKIPGAPHRVLLVLDATLGQNAIIQAREFSSALAATGVVLTKLDGSAKGGAALSVVAELGLPVEMVGVGENAKDLRQFSARDFVENLIP